MLRAKVTRSSRDLQSCPAVAEIEHKPNGWSHLSLSSPCLFLLSVHSSGRCLVGLVKNGNQPAIRRDVSNAEHLRELVKPLVPTARGRSDSQPTVQPTICVVLY